MHRIMLLVLDEAIGLSKAEENAVKSEICVYKENYIGGKEPIHNRRYMIKITFSYFIRYSTK